MNRKDLEMLDTIATPTASPTAAVCESLALFGAAPERDEFDSWDADDAIEALAEAIRVIVDGVTVEGTQLADERESLMWGFVNMLAMNGLQRTGADWRGLEGYISIC